MTRPGFEPYRMFFLSGTLLGIWGVALWILFYVHRVPYPVIQHPALMMGGFLLCFVSGFLMTAAPKFTASFPMTRFEARLSLLLNLLLIFCGVIFSSKVFYGCSLLIFVTLIFYFIRRFLSRTQNPPPSFVFIGLGLSMGLLGSFGMLTSEYVQLPESLYRLIRLFYLQGYVLSLIVGVGSRLVPALLGHMVMPTEVQANQAKGGSVTSGSKKLRVFLGLMMLFGASYVVEAFVDATLGGLVKNMIVTFVAFFFWKIHKAPQKRTRLNWGLLIASWLMLIGLWGSLSSNYRIHFLHVFFIGGLGLMTFMIAVRVVLSHGNHGLVMESKSLFIPAVVGLFAAAAVTRLSAGFLPSVYLSHLVYAAIVWCVGIGLWALILIPKILKIKS